MAKLNIDFVLIDESVVKNGFRCLMSGAKLDGFIQNPVMLALHIRGMDGLNSGNSDDILLPIGKWWDIRVEGTRLLAKPEFDDNDEFALKVESKVKGGYMNGASIWVDPIATSDDQGLMLAGQRGPTVTEWGVLEASIVDIPNCNNSLAIRNSFGKRITLSGADKNDEDVLQYLRSLIKSPNNNEMDRKLLCASLGLADSVADNVISEKLVALKNLETKLTATETENTQLKQEVVKLKKEAGEKLIADLVDGAVTSGKIKDGEKANYVKLATVDFETTKTLLDGMTPVKSLQSQLGAGGSGSDAQKLELSELVKLSGTKLYEQGLLERLKELSLEDFKLKYKEAFNVEYKG